MNCLWVFVELFPCLSRLNGFYEVQNMQKQMVTEMSGMPIEENQLEILKSLNIDIHGIRSH